MHIIKKEMEIAGAHCLNLPYDSPCRNLHGHNWKLTIYCTCEEAQLQNDMVVDFATIKKVVNQLDHQNLNTIFADLNPTAENIGKWISQQIPYCIRVDVQESQGNTAIYIVPGHEFEAILIH